MDGPLVGVWALPLVSVRAVALAPGLVPALASVRAPALALALAPSLALALALAKAPPTALRWARRWAERRETEKADCSSRSPCRSSSRTFHATMLRCWRSSTCRSPQLAAASAREQVPSSAAGSASTLAVLTVAALGRASAGEKASAMDPSLDPGLDPALAAASGGCSAAAWAGSWAVLKAAWKV